MLIRAALVVLSVSISAQAALELKARHPDEPAEYTFNERLSLKNALGTTEQVKAILHSFRRLTDISRDKLSDDELQKAGNTERDIQALAFSNIPSTIEGTLLKQDYLIKKLEYDLAVEQSKSGKMPPDKVENTRRDLEQAEKAFQKFWNSFGVAD